MIALSDIMGLETPCDYFGYSWINQKSTRKEDRKKTSTHYSITKKDDTVILKVVLPGLEKDNLEIWKNHKNNFSFMVKEDTEFFKSKQTIKIQDSRLDDIVLQEESVELKNGVFSCGFKFFDKTVDITKLLK